MARKSGSKKGASKKGGRKAKLGSGRRFKTLKGSLARKGVRNPGALAASIGRKKYGKQKMAKMSAAGRRRKKR